MKNVKLTIYEQGSLRRSTGIFEVENFEDGVHVGRCHKMVKNGLVSSQVSRVLHIDSDRVGVMISRDGLDDNIDQRTWIRMNDRERMRYHAKAISNGMPFRIEYY